MLSKQNLLGVGITNASEKEILEYITTSLEKGREKYYVVTPNPEFLVFANQHPQFKTILNNARLALSDGSGVIWAGKILGKPFKERVTGTDIVKNLCKEVCEKPITVGFLGGQDKVAEKTAGCLKTKYPGLKVAFAASEWDYNTYKIYNNYKNYSIDILFVAFGFPKQEEWIAKNLPKIPVRIAIGVGGAFDYISGKIPRAPKCIQDLGFEWLYRLIVQPWRIKRQMALIKFIFLILKERLR